MNRQSILKRLADLETGAARLPDPFTGPPSAFWTAFEADPEIVAANAVILAETGIDPRASDGDWWGEIRDYRAIGEASLTNPAVADAELRIIARQWALAEEYHPL